MGIKVSSPRNYETFTYRDHSKIYVYEKHPDSGSIYVLHKNANRTYTGSKPEVLFSLGHMISVIRQNLNHQNTWILGTKDTVMKACYLIFMEWELPLRGYRNGIEEMKNDEELRSFRNTPLSWNRCSLPFSNSRVTIPTIWLSPSTKDNWEFFIELTEKIRLGLRGQL